MPRTIPIGSVGPSDRPFLLSVVNGDGTVTLYYPGDTLPASPAFGGQAAPHVAGDLMPEDFGAPASGDCTAALQAMFAQAKNGAVIRLRRLYDISGPLTTAAHNLTVTTDTRYTGAGIRCTAPGVQILTVSGYGFRWDGPMLVGDATIGGDGAGATIKGIRLVRADGSKDIDATISGGVFTRLAECVYARGANLRVTDALFATGFRGIVIEQNGSEECRGHLIADNRFHSFGGPGAASICIDLSPAAFACEVKDNHADSIYTFYRGPNNNIDLVDNRCFRVAAEGITGINSVGADDLQKTASITGNVVYKNSPGYLLTSGISLRQVRNSVVSGNTVIGPRGHGIALYDCTANVVAGNVVVSPNFTPADPSFAGIFGDDQSIGNIVQGNVIRSAGLYNAGTMGISVHADNTVELNRVDSVYGANRYPRAVPTLGVS